MASVVPWRHRHIPRFLGTPSTSASDSGEIAFGWFSFAADGAWTSDRPRRAGGASPSSFWRMKDSPSPTMFKSGRFPQGRHVIRIFEPAQGAAHRLVSDVG